MTQDLSEKRQRQTGSGRSVNTGVDCFMGYLLLYIIDKEKIECNPTVL